MPRFMPLPKLAVGPVSEPSEPILIGAPPAPCEANSAHETVPAAAAPAGAAAAAVVGLGAAGAAVGGVVGADGVQATTVSASALSTTARAARATTTDDMAILSSPAPDRDGRNFARDRITLPARPRVMRS